MLCNHFIIVNLDFFKTPYLQKLARFHKDGGSFLFRLHHLTISGHFHKIILFLLKETLF